MTRPDTSVPARGRRVSRAPVVVVIGGLALALTAVIIGAQLSAAPPPAVSIDRPGTVALPRDVNVIMRDYVFLPTPLPLVRGETVRLNIVNGGLVAHELVLGGRPTQAAWASADAATPPGFLATQPPASVDPAVAGLRVLLESGDRSSVVYQVPEFGELQLACHLPGHVERGMVGRVDFAAPSAADGR